MNKLYKTKDPEIVIYFKLVRICLKYFMLYQLLTTYFVTIIFFSSNFVSRFWLWRRISANRMFWKRRLVAKSNRRRRLQRRRPSFILRKLTTSTSISTPTSSRSLTNKIKTKVCQWLQLKIAYTVLTHPKFTLNKKILRISFIEKLVHFKEPVLRKI